MPAATSAGRGAGGSRPGGRSKADAKRVASTAKVQTRRLANVARSDVLELVHTARGEADEVRSELGDQARSLLTDTRARVEDQLEIELRRLAAGIAGIGSQAVALATGRPDEAGALGDRAEQVAEWLDERAARLEEKGAEGVVDDITEFAARRPAIFLAGAVALGFGLGRLLRTGALTEAEEIEAARPPTAATRSVAPRRSAAAYPRAAAGGRR